MDAPRIQYARTEDGVSIAFWAIGEGYPLVVTGAPLISHVQGEWSVPSLARVYETLAERVMVIRFDPRGIGLSDKVPVDLGTVAASSDLRAVVDRLGVNHFAVFTGNSARFQALIDSVVNERVSHLAIWPAGGFISNRTERVLSYLAPLMAEDWEFYTTIRAILVRFWDPERVPDMIDIAELAGLVRQAHSPESYRAVTAAMAEATDSWLSKIETPTLVLHSLESKTQASDARRLMSLLQNAELLGIPGVLSGVRNFPNSFGLAAIADFVTTDWKRGQHLNPPALDSSFFRTILFTDLADHTAMMRRLGDAKGREVLREHERITRETLAANGGTEVKAMGDGFMASFGSAQKALECAIALQRAFASREHGTGNKEQRSGLHPCSWFRVPVPLRLHIGVNAGEPIAEDDDLFGTSVIMAARAASKAAGGQILVTNVVRELVSGKGFSFADAGEFEMKGFEELVRLYELRWQAPSTGSG